MTTTVTSEETRFRDALEQSLGRRFSDGNGIERLRNGDEIFPAMLGAMREAQDQIDFLTFVYWTGQIAEEVVETLAERSRSGVRVRVLLDAVGCARMPDRLVETLRRAGVEVVLFRPVRPWRFLKINHRTHRKILVCDGSVGFTGGVGIAEEWEGDARHPGEWRETHFELRGPAVAGLQAAFLENWSEAQGWSGAPQRPREARGTGDVPIQVVRSAGGHGWSDIRTATFTLIDQAQASLTIVTAYFVPDEPLMQALRAALRRGVQVEIMLPGSHSDEVLCNLAGADEIETLVADGATVWLYEKTMLHYKLMLVDDCLTMLGSPNFNQRSFEQDDEVSAILLSRAMTERLRSDFEEDRQEAEPFDRKRWSRRSWWTECKVWGARQLRGSL